MCLQTDKVCILVNDAETERQLHNYGHAPGPLKNFAQCVQDTACYITTTNRALCNIAQYRRVNENYSNFVDCVSVKLICACYKLIAVRMVKYQCMQENYD